MSILNAFKMFRASVGGLSLLLGSEAGRIHNCSGQHILGIATYYLIQPGSHRPARSAWMYRFRIITISMYISHSFVVGDVHVMSNSAIVNWVTSANAEVFSTLFCDRASMSSWTMEAIINMHSMSSVCEQGSMHHRVCM